MTSTDAAIARVIHLSARRARDTGLWAALAAASYRHGRPSLISHHHGSPTWNRAASPAALPIATKACATCRKYPIAVSFAGDSKVEGGSHPVSAGDPSQASCFQSAQQCWSSSS